MAQWKPNTSEEGEKSIEVPQEVILENEVILGGFLLQAKKHKEASSLKVWDPC